MYNLIYIGNYLWQSHNNKKLQVQLKDTYHKDANNQINGEDILDKFKPLLEINDEIVGWINIKDTNIDYPVVQGEDNKFYLDHNVKKEKSKAGSIFMDYRNNGDDRDKNTILYGHHMKDGTMFKDLMGYKDPNFLKDHLIISFSTLYKKNLWEIFSVYVTDIEFDYIKTDFHTDEEYHKFLEEITEKSLFNTNIQPTIEDKIITLSTCSYEFDNGRFVVHGRKINY